MALPAQEFVSGFPVSLNPTDVEKLLRELWGPIGGEKGEEKEEQGVTRITLGNVMWLGDSSQVASVREVFRDLVQQYPCRLFLIELTDDAEGIESRVNAYCFITGGRRQVCCEEIHLRAGTEGRPHLRGALLPLLVADVPTTLWTRQAPTALTTGCVSDLLRSADRLLREVGLLSDPTAALRELITCNQVALDMDWFRQSALRDQIALAFEDEDSRADAPAASSCLIRYQVSTECAGSHRSTVGAALLAGWVCARLGWNEEAALERVRLIPEAGGDGSGQVMEFDLAIKGFGRVRLGPEGRHPAAPLKDAEALGLALTMRTRGETFRKAAQCALPLLTPDLIDRGTAR